MRKEDVKFSDLLVNRLRGIEKTEIHNLSQINVFFGKNNCGKSTILEAILLLTGQSNPTLPVRINTARGYRELQNPNDVKVEFYNLDTQRPIVIESKGKDERHLEISLIRSISHGVDFNEESTTHSQMADSYFGLKLKYAGDKASEIIFKDGDDKKKARTRIDEKYQENLVARLVGPRNSSNVNDIYEMVGSIIENKQKNVLISALQILEPKLTDILVVGTNIMVDIGQEKYLPIQVMGDGIWRILSALVHIYDCANGIVLIDEVDNGLHYSVMPKFWLSIFKMVLEHNVQMFVTTHNLDSLKGLIEVIYDNKAYCELLSSYKLIKTESDEVKAVRYDAEHLNFMIEQDIEMR